LKVAYVYIPLILIILLVTSCVSYKPQYDKKWERNIEVENPYYTVFLIGDAGYSKYDEESIVFNQLSDELTQANERTAIVWLGDNIYPVGLAPSTSVYHKEGRYRLIAQLETMSNFKGQKYVVPGNHDWYTYGRIGLRRQEMLVDSFLHTTPNPNEQRNYFIPDKGCGDPQIVELTDKLSLLLMDSHWFLNEDVRKGDQSPCVVKNPKEYLDKLSELIDESNDKSLIVASHHPPYTYAHHGGKFPVKDDLFPATQVVDWLYLPLPITGFVFNRIRNRISDQDVNHPNYKKYKSGLITALTSKGKSIVASGHEHTLQYIENDSQYYIVSGAGTKRNKVGMGKGSRFSIGEKGYVKIIFKDSRHAILQFIVPGLFSDRDNIAYETSITLQ